MAQVSLKDLREYLIKPCKKRKQANKKQSSSRMYDTISKKQLDLCMDDTVSLTKTVQGKCKNTGININVHVKEFVDYSAVKLFAKDSKIYFYPLDKNSNDYDELECYTLSKNPTSRCMNTKVANTTGINKLSVFLGAHGVKRATEKDSGCTLFYIEN